MKRVAVSTSGFTNWGGGTDFLKNVLRGLLRARDNGEVELFLFLPAELPRTLEKNTRLLRRMLPSMTDRRFLLKNDRLKKLFAEFSGKLEFVYFDPQVPGHALEKLDMDVFMPLALGARHEGVECDWVGYLHDCQHRWLPELFQPETVASLDREFGEMVRCAPKLLVNSADTRKDLMRFFNASPEKIVALPFAPTVAEEWLRARPERLKKYAVPETYFLISNQFWKHKNHSTAIEAMRVLADQKVQLICTGKMEDSRSPGYVQELQGKVVEAGLKENVRFLGHIPKLDQIEILKNATALIQPTLFEGGPGGGSAYDAIALGVPCLLSDIPINREVDCGAVTFFPAKDPEALARCCRERIAHRSARPSAEVLRANSDANLRKLAHALSVFWRD